MYLFNNTPIQTRFDESDKKIASELNKITDNELLNCDLQKIADRIEQQYSIICDTEFTTEDVEPISYAHFARSVTTRITNWCNP